MNVTRTCLAATLAGAAMIACSAGPSGSTVYVVSSGWVGTDGGAVGATPAGTSECLPADVASLLDAKCAACHGDPPLASALSGLMTAADLEAPSKLDPTSNEAEESLALMALTGGVKAMPPGTGSPTADITVLKSWISAGYPTVACGATSSSGAGSSTTSTGGGSAGVPGVPCDVSTMLAASCTGCHGDPPLASALAGLVTLADLKATSKLDPTKNEAE